jgi:hypothetical protein
MTASSKRRKAKPKVKAKAKRSKKPKLSDKKPSERFIAAARSLETNETEGWFKTAVARIFRAKV